MSWDLESQTWKWQLTTHTRTAHPVSSTALTLQVFLSFQSGIFLMLTLSHGFYVFSSLSWQSQSRLLPSFLLFESVTVGYTLAGTWTGPSETFRRRYNECAKSLSPRRTQTPSLPSLCSFVGAYYMGRYYKITQEALQKCSHFDSRMAAPSSKGKLCVYLVHVPVDAEHPCSTSRPRKHTLLVMRISLLVRYFPPPPFHSILLFCSEVKMCSWNFYFLVLVLGLGRAPVQTTWPRPKENTWAHDDDRPSTRRLTCWPNGRGRRGKSSGTSFVLG